MNDGSHVEKIEFSTESRVECYSNDYFQRYVISFAKWCFVNKLLIDDEQKKKQKTFVEGQPVRIDVPLLFIRDFYGYNKTSRN